jgi:hypothetical protein
MKDKSIRMSQNRIDDFYHFLKIGIHFYFFKLTHANNKLEGKYQKDHNNFHKIGKKSIHQKLTIF